MGLGDPMCCSMYDPPKVVGVLVPTTLGLGAAAEMREPGPGTTPAGLVAQNTAAQHSDTGTVARQVDG